ncbi:GLPGLI family protein [Urechidicola vernalis]|uniref:GLPGLI family protein n=1 Tax=Urechidicola vernalis TaxID=3075600 RepID=A0ABU2Y5Z2_9FLAO|nr:GLPGLI family protein [Urechidicola sp. P050]MDT0552478.1 GLPGLI family protein [Urechidicola sp. P050]
MKRSILSKPTFVIGLLLPLFMMSQDFQGKAYYFSKSKMELGSFGATMSEAQKKQIAERLKNRLEQTYILTFNKEGSTFKEDEKVDAYSGATDTWGKNFTPGVQYKNVKTKSLLQKQDFYGKQFLVKDKLLEIDWKIGKETKKIGNYLSIKATAVIPSKDLNWYDFSWGQLQNTDDEGEEKEEPMTEVTAWYTPQIPLNQGPLEYWGLPGLILEVNVGNTTMLCSKIVMNPDEKTNIKIPEKGKEVTKAEYQEIISNKMVEMRNNRTRGRRSN